MVFVHGIHDKRRLMHLQTCQNYLDYDPNQTSLISVRYDGIMNELNGIYIKEQRVTFMLTRHSGNMVLVFIFSWTHHHNRR